MENRFSLKPGDRRRGWEAQILRLVYSYFKINKFKHAFQCRGPITELPAHHRTERTRGRRKEELKSVLSIEHDDAMLRWIVWGGGWSRRKKNIPVKSDFNWLLCAINCATINKLNWQAPTSQLLKVSLIWRHCVPPSSLYQTRPVKITHNHRALGGGERGSEVLMIRFQFTQVSL